MLDREKEVCREASCRHPFNFPPFGPSPRKGWLPPRWVGAREYRMKMPAPLEETWKAEDLGAGRGLHSHGNAGGAVRPLGLLAATINRRSRRKGLGYGRLVFPTTGAGPPSYIGPSRRTCSGCRAPTSRSQGPDSDGAERAKDGPTGRRLGSFQGVGRVLGGLEGSLTAVYYNGCDVSFLEDFNPSMERGG